MPTSGLLTAQDCCKTQDEVDRFGGYPAVLTFVSKAFADMTRSHSL